MLVLIIINNLVLKKLQFLRIAFSSNIMFFWKKLHEIIFCILMDLLKQNYFLV